MHTVNSFTVIFSHFEAMLMSELNDFYHHRQQYSTVICHKISLEFTPVTIPRIYCRSGNFHVFKFARISDIGTSHEV